MKRIVLLDAGPLGLVTNPKQSPRSMVCNQWLQSLLSSGVRVMVPEITDYEVRRELLRARKTKGLQRLDDLVKVVEYLPLTTAVMRDAAQLWAQIRQLGKPTADRHALDGDVILAAQARSIPVGNVIVATTNVGHLVRLTQAALWTDVQ